MDKAVKTRGKGDKKRRFSRFWIGLLILLAVNAVVIAALLRWLYVILEDFELQSPNTALSTYFTRLSAGEHDELMRTARFTPDDATGWDDYFAMLGATFNTEPSELSFRMTSSPDIAQSDTLYAVYAGEEKLGEVLLFEDAQSEGGWAVSGIVTPIEGYTITAPSFATVYVNGVELTQADALQDVPVIISYTLNGAPIEVNIFEKMDEPSLAPVLTQYKGIQTYATPVITATDANGGELAVEIDEENLTARVLFPPSAEDEAAAIELMDAAARAYSDFITEDGTVANLLQYVSQDTALYQEFQEYQRGWYVDHESREFLDFEFSDISYFSDTCFIGHADFTVNITQGGELHTFLASYDMAFMLFEDEWLLVGMHARPV